MLLNSTFFQDTKQCLFLAETSSYVVPNSQPHQVPAGDLVPLGRSLRKDASVHPACRDLDDAFVAEETPVTEAWGCGRAGHSHAKVGEKHVLAAFGALPGLLDTFARDGISSQDEEGNTVLHRYMSVLSKCTSSVVAIVRRPQHTCCFTSAMYKAASNRP